MTPTSAPSFPMQIFVAGDPTIARQTCRRYCMDAGFCVTVTETEYVYTGGQERGVIVGIIHYPRFPSSPEVLTDKARTLACRLMDDLCQRSCSVQTPTETLWLAREAA